MYLYQISLVSEEIVYREINFRSYEADFLTRRALIRRHGNRVMWRISLRQMVDFQIRRGRRHEFSKTIRNDHRSFRGST